MYGGVCGVSVLRCDNFRDRMKIIEFIISIPVEYTLTVAIIATIIIYENIRKNKTSKRC